MGGGYNCCVSSSKDGWGQNQNSPLCYCLSNIQGYWIVLIIPLITSARVYSAFSANPNVATCTCHSFLLQPPLTTLWGASRQIQHNLKHPHTAREHHKHHQPSIHYGNPISWFVVAAILYPKDVDKRRSHSSRTGSCRLSDPCSRWVVNQRRKSSSCFMWSVTWIWNRRHWGEDKELVPNVQSKCVIEFIRSNPP